MVSDAGGSWISRPVSAVCSGLSWTHREVICEEDYMEVRTTTISESLSLHEVLEQTYVKVNCLETDVV